MANDTIIRFSISLPEELLGALDQQIIAKGYASRSELVRDLIREQLVEDQWNSNSEVVIGVLTLIYDHHHRDLLQRMTDLQHDTTVQILCNTHVHIDHHNCLETIMMKGSAKEVKEISTKISGLKGINFSELTKTSTF